MAFDYGADPVESAAPKNCSVGPHSARVRSIIHLGPIPQEYKGVSKGIAPVVAVIMELKGKKDFEDDGETPLDLDKDIALKKGTKAKLTEFMSAVDADKTAEGFDDIIGRPLTVMAVGSKELDDDNLPKYVNCGGFAGLAEEFQSLVPELNVKGVGHVRFEDLTKDAILELHPIRHIALTMMKSPAYPGSKAEEIIKEIRKENPDFAVQSSKDEGQKNANSEPAPPPDPNLNENEEF
jgi:hypothetical protein